MIGAIVMMIGIYLTGAVETKILRKLKTKHLDFFKKYRFALILPATILFFILGVFLSFVAGGWVNKLL